MRLTEGMKRLADRAWLHGQMREQARDLRQTHPARAAAYGDLDDLHRLLCAFIDEVIEAGLTDPDLRARCLLMAFVVHPQPWPAFRAEPVREMMRRAPEHADDAFRDYCSLLKLNHERHGVPDLVWW